MVLQEQRPLEQLAGAECQTGQRAPELDDRDGGRGGPAWRHPAGQHEPEQHRPHGHCGYGRAHAGHERAHGATPGEPAHLVHALVEALSLVNAPDPGRRCDLGSARWRWELG